MRLIFTTKSSLGFVSALLILVVGLILSTHSCTHEGIPADQMEEICFTRQVLPVFQNSCATTDCHDAITAEDGYIFTDYANIMKSIEPGNASKSKAYKAITSHSEIMPPDNPLPIDKRTLIMQWIEQGAKETTCESTIPNPDTKSGTQWACYDRDIQPIFNSSCAVSGCHNSITHEEGIDLSRYAHAFTLIKPGNPDGSKLYEAITENPNSEDFMPHKPYSPLSQAAIDTIYSWIKRGGLNEECASLCDTTGTVAFTSHIKPIIDMACISCHGLNNPPGGITFTTVENVKTVAQSGKLLAAVKRTGTKAMPPTYALDECRVSTIELWINQGYH
jgi:uncharacterized membrane protein